MERPDRYARRKAATRSALVAAARELVVEEGPEISVQAIADRADVALGSFYNHFDGKPAVFAAAATDALVEFEAWLVATTAHLADVTIMFCTRMRLFGRMTDSHPHVAAVLTRVPPSPSLAPHGYSVQAREDVDRSELATRFTPAEVDIRLIAAHGGFMEFVSLRMRDPEVPPERADDLAAVMLQLFEVPRAVAEEMAHRPLDEVLHTGVSMPFGS